MKEPKEILLEVTVTIDGKKYKKKVNLLNLFNRKKTTAIDFDDFEQLFIDNLPERIEEAFSIISSGLNATIKKHYGILKFKIIKAPIYGLPKEK